MQMNMIMFSYYRLKLNNWSLNSNNSKDEKCGNVCYISELKNINFSRSKYIEDLSSHWYFFAIKYERIKDNINLYETAS